MGRQIIWDGAGLPEIGDEVKFEVASTPIIQVGRVVRLEVTRYDKTRLNCWRIMVHMQCGSEKDPYPMCRLLEEVYPLSWTKS